jgi:DUF1680 family protein
MRKYFLLIVMLGVSVAYGQQQKIKKPGIVTTLNGEVGEAEQRAIKRFFQPPFNNLGWIRADLTNETVTADDHNNSSVMKRPFKEFSGDISGRYLELMALLSRGNNQYHPVLKEMLHQVASLQKRDGTFGWGDIDWHGPIDFNGRTPLMMPALWGNGRMLCGLIASYDAFRDPALLASAKKLGDFYVRTANRFMNPDRVDEYKKGGTYASGFVTCYFNAFEGLVKLYRLTKDTRYLQVSEQMAEFLVNFDHLPVDHTHGMLCNQFALLLLFEQTGKQIYLERVETRWNEMIKGYYIDPAGGVLEKAQIGFNRDEGCAEADWLRVNLELFKITTKAQYLDMSERLLQNHFLANQNSSGGFGHRFIINDKLGTIGFGTYNKEATWCCDFHGTQAFELLKPFICSVDQNSIHINYAMDFTSTVSNVKYPYQISSVCLPFTVTDHTLKQKISLTGTKNNFLIIRSPSWSSGIVARHQNGKLIPLVFSGSFYKTAKAIPANQTIILEYNTPVRVEDRAGSLISLKADRHIGGIVLRHGPKLLMANGLKTIPELLLELNQLGEISYKNELVVQNATNRSKQPIVLTLAPHPIRADSSAAIFLFDVKIR